MLKKIISLCLLAAVTACGGGSGSTPPGPAPYGLTFKPSTITGENFLGTTQTFTFNLLLDRVLTESADITIVDKLGVIEPTFTLTPITKTSYDITIRSQANLPAGNYKGAFEIRLCQDVATTCAIPLAGSPWVLPYDFKVLGNLINLSPLSPLAGAGDWGMHQGNASHTGYVPVTLDPSKFNLRWKWTAPVMTSIHPVVTSGGSVFVSTANPYGASTLFVLSEAERTERWQHDFGSVGPVNPPAVSDGKVFLTSTGNQNTFMWSFDTSTGNQLSRQPFSSQADSYYSPTIFDGAVFNGGGLYGGMLSFKQIDGSMNWENNVGTGYQWTPAVDASHAYAFFADGLNVVNKANGALQFKISDLYSNQVIHSFYSSPIIGSSNNVLSLNGRGSDSGSNRLNNFDIGAKNIKWTVSGKITNDPALANGVIYMANGPQIEARNESDGALLWTWVPLEAGDPFYNGYSAIPGNLIATDNLLFVSTKTMVYALSLQTHQPVWAYPITGKFAMSANGILYLSANEKFPNGEIHGVVYAVNLR